MGLNFLPITSYHHWKASPEEPNGSLVTDLAWTNQSYSPEFGFGIHLEQPRSDLSLPFAK
jgi:hypothetical protein